MWFPQEQLCSTELFMEQNSSWEANGVSDSQQISRISWSPNFHDCLQYSLTLFRILSQCNPLYVFSNHSFETHFNIILPTSSK